MRARAIAILAGILMALTLPVASWAQTVSGPAPSPEPAAAPNPFADWSAFVIAGDYRASTGMPSEVFDNGRRELARAFADIGIPEDNIAQFSVRPHRYPEETPLTTEPVLIESTMKRMAEQNSGGCLFYFTSHGSPEGVILADLQVRPYGFETLLESTCGQRPTVAVISACYSGIFIPVLEDSNRMVMTAAREDRTSFGCGENDVYTFFDQCFLESLPEVQNFDALATETRTCVSDREVAMEQSPPSEPQVATGVNFRMLMPLLRLDQARSPP